MGANNCTECLENEEKTGKEIYLNPSLYKKESYKKSRPLLKNNNNNNIIKEERDNNILLKKELNKIKDISNISKLIEEQRKQIKSQEKIIEEYKNKESLYINQQKQMELTQKIIREQQEILNKEKTKKGLPASKSTPIIKSFLNNNIQNLENQIEENDNYEIVDINEEEDKIKNDIEHSQSKKFKIETYEPIENGNINEENNILNNSNVINKIDLEPRDSYKINIINKKEIEPLDKNKNEININFRGTFENKQNKEDQINNYRNSNDINYIENNNYENNMNKINDNVNEVLIQPHNINIFNNNENNIYFSQEFNMNMQPESPKFNYSKYDEGINSSLKGPYLNDIDNINTIMSAPINFNQIENPLIYNDDRINTNF